MKTLIVFTVLKSELEIIQDSLKESLENIRSCFQSSYDLLFVIQGEKISLPEFITDLSNGTVVFIKESSLSKARNFGLDYMTDNSFSHVLFHDSRITLSKSFCSYISRGSYDPLQIKIGTVAWRPSFPVEDFGQIRKVSPNIFRNPYLWSYHLPANFIQSLRFNENIGPGLNTKLKSGEDALFLYQLFKLNNIKFLVKAKRALIFHPSRNDNKKRVEYAQGQGALLRYFIHYNFLSYGVTSHFIFFWLNALKLILSLNPDSLNIFMLRLRGFISNDFKSFKDTSC